MRAGQDSLDNMGAELGGKIEAGQAKQDRLEAKIETHQVELVGKI